MVIDVKNLLTTYDFKSAGTPGGRLSFLMPGGKSALYTYNKKDNKD